MNNICMVCGGEKPKEDYDWPGKRSQKKGYMLGYVGCPHCGTPSCGVVNLICNVCDKPRFSKEELEYALEFYKE